MTLVIIAPRVEDMGSATEPVLTDWWFHIRPSRTVEGEDWVLDEWPPVRQVSLTPIDLDPLDFAYELEMFRGTDLRTPRLHEFRIVPDSATPLKWQLLERVGGPGSEPPVLSELEARVALLEAALGTVSGGASQLDEIVGMTATAQSLNQQTSVANMRTFLDVPATSALSAISAKADLASPALTGNPTAPTPTAGDNDTSIATTAFVTAAIAGKAGTSSPTISNITLTGTVTMPDGALAIADVSGLQTALDSSGAASYIPIDWDGVGPFARPSSDVTKRYEFTGPLPAPPVASPANTGTAGMYNNDRFTLRE